MNSAASVAGLFSPFTVAATCTVAGPSGSLAGLRAMHVVSLLQVMPSANRSLNLIVVAPGVVLKPPPVTTTDVPPAGVPLRGLRPPTASPQVNVALSFCRLRTLSTSANNSAVPAGEAGVGAVQRVVVAHCRLPSRQR